VEMGQDRIADPREQLERILRTSDQIEHVSLQECDRRMILLFALLFDLVMDVRISDDSDHE